MAFRAQELPQAGGDQLDVREASPKPGVIVEYEWRGVAESFSVHEFGPFCSVKQSPKFRELH